MNYNFKESLESTIYAMYLEIQKAETSKDLKSTCEDLVYYVSATVRDFCSNKECE